MKELHLRMFWVCFSIGSVLGAMAIALGVWGVLAQASIFWGWAGFCVYQLWKEYKRQRTRT